MAQSRMFAHIVKLYAYMESQSYTDDDGTQIYRGFLSTVIREELGLSPGYYTPLKRILEEQGCIIQRRRGGGTSPSEWVLTAPPNEELFSHRLLDASVRRKTPQQSQEILHALARLSERLGRVEELVEILRSGATDGNNRLGNSKPMPEMRHAGDGS